MFYSFYKLQLVMYISVIILTAISVKFGSKNERRGGWGKSNKHTQRHLAISRPNIFSTLVYEISLDSGPLQRKLHLVIQTWISVLIKETVTCLYRASYV